jgi:hypothetical protein
VELESKIFAAVLGLCAQLSFVTPTQAELIQTSDRALPQAVFVPNTGPEQRSLTPVSFSPLVVAGEILGEVVVYDDPTTKRPADYFELYDNTGDLIAVGWFDRFGIQRMAVDRGLFAGKDEPEGVFVSLLEGDSI